MALGLTPEHLELAASVQGWAARHSPPAAVRAAAEGNDAGAASYRGELVSALADQGLLGLHLAESDGGQGFGLPELAIATAELGYALLPGAFLPTVFASCVLSEAGGSTANLIAKLADGSLTGTVCLAKGLTSLGNEHASEGSLVVSGDVGPVLAGAMADIIVAAVDLPQGEAWVVLDSTDLHVRPVDGVDLTRPLASITADGVHVQADRVLAGVDRASITSLAAILFGAEACGIANWAVRTAADYAKIRHQFGRPIGQFQAVKHRCARMLTAAEQAAAAVWDAARTEPGTLAAGASAADTPEPGGAEAAGRQREFAAGVAAVVAVDAAVWCAHQYIQVLGGIGYTWEHESHLYYRRALSLLGPSDEWARRVAELALSGVRRPVQVELPGGDAELRAQIREELSAIAGLAGAERTQRLAADGWVVPHL